MNKCLCGGFLFAAIFSVLTAGTPRALAQIDYEVYWTAQDGLSLEDGPAAVAVEFLDTPGGDVFVTGYRTTGPGTSEWVTTRYTADELTGGMPDVVWSETFSNSNYTGLARPRAMVHDGSNGALYVVGEAPGPDGDLDFVLIRYDADDGDPYAPWTEDLSGDGAGVRRYNGSADGDDSAQAVAVSGSSIYVTGPSDGSTTGTDYAVVKFTAGTGAFDTSWDSDGVVRYDGPGSGDDTPVAILVRGQTGGYVYVTGTVWAGSTQEKNYTTILYDASDGSQEWVAAYNGTGSGNDIVVGMAPGSGHDSVFVTGQSQAQSGPPTQGFGDPCPTQTVIDPSLDIVTIAYGPSSSTPLWTPVVFDGAAELGDYPTGITKAGSNIWISATSVGTDGYADLKLLQYSASNGTTSWSDSDGRYTVAGDHGGMDVASNDTFTVVTGWIKGLCGDSRILTVRFSATGGVDWAETIGDTISGNHGGMKVALDTTGTSSPNTKPKIIVASFLYDSTDFEILTTKYVIDEE